MQMMISFTSSSSSSSSSRSSSGRCHPEEKDMRKFEHLHLHHTPPPLPAYFKGKKYHRHRHHSCTSPPPPLHRRHHFIEHPYHSPLLHSADHHHLEKGKLRVKPPKPSKKVRKLHHKLMKASYKLPKSAIHGRHYHDIPPNGAFFTHITGDHHPPGCCLQSMEKGFSGEERAPLQEMGFRQHCRPRRRAHSHSSDTHKSCPMRPFIKSEIVGGAVAVESPSAAEAPAEPPTEGGKLPPASAILPADEMLPADEKALAQ